MLGGALIALVALTAWLLTGKTRGAEIANVLALPVGLAGVVLTLIGLWVSEHVITSEVAAAAADSLRRRVRNSEWVVLQRLLADSGHARPADLSFTQPLRARTDGGDSEGSLRRIGAFYGGLKHGRLAVIGDPGAGKTVLAIQLMLDLLDHSAERVPVRFNLATLPNRAGDPRERFERWIVDELVHHHGQRPAVAQALVNQDRILPVLDGLDEMDADDGNTVRADEVVQALNHPGRFVLTCRSDRYHSLDATPADTTVVVAEGLSSDQVIDWLLHRFADPSHDSGVQRRWRPVIFRLRRHPTGALARALSSPLRLYLAVTMYAAPDSQPKKLVGLKATEIDEHLLVGLVPAIVRQHPYRHGTFLDAENVTRWLRQIAVRMSQNETVDLRLDTLWPDSIRQVRMRRIALFGVAAVMTLAFAVNFGARLVDDWRSNSAEPEIIIGAAVWAGIMVGVACYRPARHGSLYRRLERRRIAWTDHKVALLIAIFVGFAQYTSHGLLGGVILAAAVCGLFTLHWWSSSNARIADPRTIVRDGIIYDLVVITAFAVLLPLSSITDSLASGMPLHVALVAHLPGCLAGAVLGLVFRTRSPWPSYFLAVVLQARRNQCPYQFATFLAWTGRSGLTRMSGMAVQFRHGEIQNWLTRHSQQSAPVRMDACPRR